MEYQERVNKYMKIFEEQFPNDYNAHPNSCLASAEFTASFFTRNMSSMKDISNKYDINVNTLKRYNDLLTTYLDIQDELNLVRGIE